MKAVSIYAGVALASALPGLCSSQHLPTRQSSRSAEPAAEVRAVRQAAVTDAEARGLRVLELQRVYQRQQVIGWSVVLGRRPPTQSQDRPFPQITEVILCLCVPNHGRYTCVSRKGPLLDPRFGHDPAGAVSLDGVDLNHDGMTEVIVTQTRPGASWEPACAFVFRLAEKSLVPAGTLTSHYPIHPVLADTGEQFVLPAAYAIGKSLPHYQQPRWTDFYGFNGKRLFLANRLCQHEFAAWPGKLRGLLEEHPSDPELWFFLGRAYEALGDEKQATGALAKADSLGYRGPDWKRLRAGLHGPEVRD